MTTTLWILVSIAALIAAPYIIAGILWVALLIISLIGMLFALVAAITLGIMNLFARLFK